MMLLYLLKVLKQDFNLPGTCIYTDMYLGDISVVNVTTMTLISRERLSFSQSVCSYVIEIIKVTGNRICEQPTMQATGILY